MGVWSFRDKTKPLMQEPQEQLGQWVRDQTKVMDIMEIIKKQKNSIKLIFIVDLNVLLILTVEKIFLLYYFHAHGLCNQRRNNNSPCL